MRGKPPPLGLTITHKIFIDNLFAINTKGGKMQANQDTWCSKELSSIKLTDKRLNRRLLKVAGDLLEQPDVPIHVACHDWAQAKAAYRLFDNDKFDELSLLRAHRQETIKRIEASTSGLLIENQIFLNYF